MKHISLTTTSEAVSGCRMSGSSRTPGLRSEEPSEVEAASHRLDRRASKAASGREATKKGLLPGVVFGPVESSTALSSEVPTCECILSMGRAMFEMEGASQKRLFVEPETPPAGSLNAIGRVSAFRVPGWMSAAWKTQL